MPQVDREMPSLFDTHTHLLVEHVLVAHTASSSSGGGGGGGGSPSHPGAAARASPSPRGAGVQVREGTVVSPGSINSVVLGRGGLLALGERGNHLCTYVRNKSNLESSPLSMETFHKEGMEGLPHLRRNPTL